jgi:hypothetical protein
MTVVDSVVDVEKLSNWIGLHTKSSKEYLSKQLNNWTYDSNKLQQLSKKFNRFKMEMEKENGFYEECDKIFREVSEIEEKLSDLTNAQTEMERESYGEILFFRPLLQPLNYFSYFLMIWATVRVYILPGISFLLPILTLIAPYIILKCVFCIPMTFKNYMTILHSMLSGNMQSIINPNMSPEINPSSFMKQFGVVIITIVQGIVQPYWTYKHLKSIDDIIYEKGELVMRCKELYERLETILSLRGFTFFKSPLPEFSSPREATARIILESTYFKLALKYIGSLEVIIQLAHKKEIHTVQWIKSSNPIFDIQDTFDFQVPTSQRKSISASFRSQSHALLTGPNKGGKSTVLRALSLSALLSHTYGCSIGHLTSTPFYKMFVCLKPDDLPGSKSRFEREIEFTAHTLTYQLPILIFIDELYHSTNPPDALRSCEIYCQQLWNQSQSISVISTHLFELVEKAPSNIQRICCQATTDTQGNIQFLYNLTSGICKVSSVDTLLRSNGLLK